MRSLVVSSFLGLGLLAVGCAPETPKKIPVQKFEKADYNPGKVVFEPKADILFLIDNSGSMGDHQAALSFNAKLFIRAMSKNNTLDYHMGVITTDYEDDRGQLFGQRLRYITRTTQNGLARLRPKLTPGTNGSGSEKIFDPLVAAFSEPNLSGFNKGFLRPDAHLVVIIMTDAEDQSRIETAETTAKLLYSLKEGNADRVLTYAVLSPTDVPSSECSKDGDDPLRIDKFLEITKGIQYSLCDEEFGENLAAIGAAISRRVSRWIPLSELPLAESIEVKFGTQVILNHPTKGWTYDPERVGISLGEDLELSDQPFGTNLTVNFARAPL